MYQSHVYLEVRILVPGIQQAFFSDNKTDLVYIEKSVLEKVAALVQSLGSNWVGDTSLQRITSSLIVPEPYKITGYSLVIGQKGHLDIEFHSRKKQIQIEEIRFEEDAGRLTHSDGNTRMDYTNVGMPSIRIKTSNTFELGEEAELFLNELRRLVQYLQLVNDLPVENVIRCNAYVALAKYPEIPAYYVKLRNLHSFNFVRKAINSELSRQEEILMSGGTVLSESRLWNERQNITEPYKSRCSVDIRQFENVPGKVVCLDDKDNECSISDVFSSIPNVVEIPVERRDRLSKEYGLSRNRSALICDEKSRGDFFEQVVKLGANPMDSAHWLTSEITRILKRNNQQLGSSNLTPEKFAVIISLFSKGKIHSGIAKQLFQSVIETGLEPEILLKKNNWIQITSEKELLPYVEEVISSNPIEAEKIRSGAMAPLEFLTGIIMKQTKGLANPVIVKSLLKKQLNISVVYILSLGGAICGYKRTDGAVAPTDDKVLSGLLSSVPESVRYQVVSLGQLLSEEIEPSDWALLVSEISTKITAGTANGIVVAHGTDTLPYTAALLYWLFSDAGVPVVLTASSRTPDVSDEAKINMTLAVETACKKKSGVYVAFGGKILSPLNLKFMRPDTNGFVNWNLKELAFTESGPLATQFAGFTELDSFVLKQVLREAADSMVVCRVYPGLRAELYASLIDEGVSRFILELYETGTGSMRGSDYSLKSLLHKGRKKNCRFYCTSQQESCIDFSEYTTSRRVWREGAVPMGRLTTESAVALYFAVSLVSDSQEEFDQFMETYAEMYN